MVRVDEESLSDYGPARHCPLQPSSVLGGSYTAVVKLEYGRTSTTWLAQIASMCHLWLMVFISLFVLDRGAYKVLKVGAADVTDRETSTLDIFATTASHTEDPGSICVCQP